MHFTELVGKGFPLELTSLSSVYSDIPGSKMPQPPLTVTSKSLSQFLNESMYNVPSAGAI